MMRMDPHNQQPGTEYQQYRQPEYGAGYPQQPYQPGPVFQAKFRRHTGLLIIAQWQDSYATGTYDQIRQAYRAAQTHNLLAGWWGLISLLIYNWIALFGNMSEMSRIKQQARAAGLEV